MSTEGDGSASGAALAHELAASPAALDVLELRLSPAEAAKRALSELQGSLGEAVRNFTVLENRDWVYARQETTLMGRQLLLSYKYSGVVFDKRIIVLPRFEGTVVHVWSYTAPRAQYYSLHPKAERILRSWTILP